MKVQASWKYRPHESTDLMKVQSSWKYRHHQNTGPIKVQASWKYTGPMKVQTSWKYRPHESTGLMKVYRPHEKYRPHESTGLMKVQTSWKCRPHESVDLMKVQASCKYCPRELGNWPQQIRRFVRRRCCLKWCFIEASILIVAIYKYCRIFMSESTDVCFPCTIVPLLSTEKIELCWTLLTTFYVKKMYSIISIKNCNTNMYVCNRKNNKHRKLKTYFASVSKTGFPDF